MMYTIGRALTYYVYNRRPFTRDRHSQCKIRGYSEGVSAVDWRATLWGVAHFWLRQRLGMARKTCFPLDMLGNFNSCFVIRRICRELPKCHMSRVTFMVCLLRWLDWNTSNAPLGAYTRNIQSTIFTCVWKVRRMFESRRCSARLLFCGKRERVAGHIKQNLKGSRIVGPLGAGQAIVVATVSVSLGK